MQDKMITQPFQQVIIFQPPSHLNKVAHHNLHFRHLVRKSSLSPSNFINVYGKQCIRFLYTSYTLYTNLHIPSYMFIIYIYIQYISSKQHILIRMYIYTSYLLSYIVYTLSRTQKFLQAPTHRYPSIPFFFFTHTIK